MKQKIQTLLTAEKRTEFILMIAGILLIALSSALLLTHTSFVSVRSGDAFQGNYAQAPALSPTPLASASPVNGTDDPFTTATATPAPTNEKAFLLFPAANAMLTKTGYSKKGYPLRFKFEVSPKETECTFELYFNGKAIISKALNRSPSGLYEVSILIRKPGLYIWKILTPHSSSESRELTIKE